MGDSSLSVWRGGEIGTSSYSQHPYPSTQNHMVMSDHVKRHKGYSGSPLESGVNYPSGIILSESKFLLTLMTYIRGCQTPPDTDLLHKRALGQVRQFMQKCRDNHYPDHMIECATYCLCAAIDEAVLSTHWGTQSIWVQKTLLSLFGCGNLGGEKFYRIIEELVGEPRKNLELLELIYFILSLGFEGKYYGKHRIYRDEIRNRLFVILKANKEKLEMRLSPHWKDDQPIVDRKHRQKRLRKMFFTYFGLFSISWVTLNCVAYQHSRGLLKKLDEIGQESPVTAYSQLIERALFPNQYKHE